MNTTPERLHRDFPLIGIGASAGGLEAVRKFLEAIPGETGMAFVLIMHLSPERESRLSEVLQTVSRMPVIEVKETVEVEADHFYVISPGRALILKNGRLVPVDTTRGKKPEHSQVVIDRFFRALADQWRERSVGIVLSGSGTDGTLGIRAIREANGLTMAQAPAEAQFHAMPASAIDTGLVDITAPVDELARRLVSMRATIGEFELPVEEEALADTEDKRLEKILARVQAETDHDFTGYKRSTVLRRIARRMQANEVDSLGQYLDYIAEHEGETRSLFRDLLISVTNFFRDPDAFQTLSEQVIPRILAEKERGDAVRIWVPGCATGEEAYSLSILMAEAVHRTEEVPTVQIFGTDVDGEAILRARQGLYPDSISVDVSSERLDRFFIRENSHYRVRKHIRETVLFARHNLLRDPPFSEIDLISCRNVLIYLQRKQQEPVFEMFHFALRNGGYLFLGPSESAESVPNLFTVIDKKTSIYRRRPGTSHPIRFSRMLVNKPDGLQVPRGTVEDKKSREVDYAEKHRGLIVDQYSPTSILVREDYTVVDVAKRGSALLQYPEGQAPHAVLDIVADDLRPPLRTALFQFFKKGESSEKTVRSGSGENEQSVRLVVQKVEFDDGMAQVLLERGGRWMDCPRNRTDRPRPISWSSSFRRSSAIRKNSSNRRSSSMRPRPRSFVPPMKNCCR